MAYATREQLYERYDRRLIDQMSNDGNALSPSTAIIDAALEDATGDIQSSALQGGMYTSAQLLTLATNQDSTIVRLTCDLAMRYLAYRRGQGLPPQIETQVDKAFGLLNSLRKGTEVLDVAQNRNAEQPNIVELTQNEKSNLGLLQNSTFFGGVTKTRTTSG